MREFGWIREWHIATFRIYFFFDGIIVKISNYLFLFTILDFDLRVFETFNVKHWKNFTNIPATRSHGQKDTREENRRGEYD